MTAHVFLSSTGEDLKDDCRPGAAKAIQQAYAVVIAQESWDTDYVFAPDVCREQIETLSTHYLGIFAYRRGWVPPGYDKSITELEFDWAQQARKRQAVLVPEPDSDFAAELMERAASQSEDDADAQKAFREKISNGGAWMPFSDVVDLALKVQRRVASWNRGGLRSVAAEANPTTRTTGARPQRSDLQTLGRTKAVRVFQDCLANNVLCALIHGPTGSWHDQLAGRLEAIAEGACGPGALTRRTALSATLKDSSLDVLTERISLALELRPPTPGSALELATRILEKLRERDIVLRVDGLQRLEKGVPGFASDFWTPLVGTLAGQSAHRFVMIATHEGQDLAVAHPDDVAVAVEDEVEEVYTVDAARPLALPVLGKITAKQLSRWVRRWVPEEAAANALADVLIAETEGEPALLFEKLLLDDSTWE